MPESPPPVGYDSDALTPRAKKVGCISLLCAAVMIGVLVYIKTNPSPEQIEREITNEKRWLNEEVLRLTYSQEPDTKLCFIRKGESSIIRDLSWVPCTDEVLNVIKNGRPNDR